MHGNYDNSAGHLRINAYFLKFNCLPLANELNDTKLSDCNSKGNSFMAEQFSLIKEMVLLSMSVLEHGQFACLGMECT
jgi:hypothetical protein